MSIEVLTKEVRDLYIKLRNKWLDSLNANEYDSLNRSNALDSLSLFCAKHEVRAVRIAREELVAEHKREINKLLKEMNNLIETAIKAHELTGKSSMDLKYFKERFKKKFLNKKEGVSE